MINNLLILKIIKIILVVGVIGMLIFDVYLIIIQPEAWRGNTSEVTAPFIIFFLLPILIFYTDFSDYTKSLIEKQKLNFWKTLGKVISISIFLSLFGVWISSFSASGEEQLGVVLGYIFVPLISSIIAILLTIIFYFVNKHKVRL